MPICDFGEKKRQKKEAAAAQKQKEQEEQRRRMEAAREVGVENHYRKASGAPPLDAAEICRGDQPVREGCKVVLRAGAFEEGCIRPGEEGTVQRIDSEDGNSTACVISSTGQAYNYWLSDLKAVPGCVPASAQPAAAQAAAGTAPGAPRAPQQPPAPSASAQPAQAHQGPSAAAAAAGAFRAGDRVTVAPGGFVDGCLRPGEVGEALDVTQEDGLTAVLVEAPSGEVYNYWGTDLAHAAPQSAPLPAGLAVGCMVEIHSLAKAAHFNGRQGRVFKMRDDGCALVDFADGERKLLKCANLRVVHGASDQSLHEALPASTAGLPGVRAVDSIADAAGRRDLAGARGFSPPTVETGASANDATRQSSAPAAPRFRHKARVLRFDDAASTWTHVGSGELVLWGMPSPAIVLVAKNGSELLRVSFRRCTRCCQHGQDTAAVVFTARVNDAERRTTIAAQFPSEDAAVRFRASYSEVREAAGECKHRRV